MLHVDLDVLQRLLLLFWIFGLLLDSLLPGILGLLFRLVDVGDGIGVLALEEKVRVVGLTAFGVVEWGLELERVGYFGELRIRDEVSVIGVWIELANLQVA